MNKMKYVLLKVAVNMLKLIYLPISLLPLQNKVSIMSRQSDVASLDIEMLKLGMHQYYPDIKVVIMTKKIGTSPRAMISYIFHVLYQAYAIATSRVIIIDGYCMAVCLLKHKKETKVIQIWHALAAIKKFGYQSIGTPAGSNEKLAQIMKMHDKYDYVLCSGENTAKHFCEGFNVDRNKIRLIGLPRIDYIIKDDPDIINMLNKKYGATDKLTVLYAPTFRKGKHINMQELSDNLDSDKVRMIVKLHPLDETIVGEGIHIDREHSTYDLMKYSDIIITDYSALGVEASLLSKPLLFFLYDYDEYSKTPGLNVDLFEEMGQYAVKDAEELVHLLGEDYNYEAVNRFREKYIQVNCNNCTKQICDFITAVMNKEDL